MSGLPGRAAAPRVIVTRPAREAAQWAEDLQAHGVDCEALPLIQIEALAEASALQAAWCQVPAHLAVMFVSANAVRFFMAERPAHLDLKACRAWSTGPGTRAALLACGWPADQIDSPVADASQFDSEALWALVALRTQASVQALVPTSVLIVRGADAHGQMAGRDWLLHKLAHTGVQVQQVVAYVRRSPALSPLQKHRVLQAMADGSWWLFSSAQAAQHLWQMCPDVDMAKAKALATHPRIAQRLRAQGWGRVETVPAGLDALAVSIKSLS